VSHLYATSKLYQYLLSLQTAVQAIMGMDISPRNFAQTSVAAFGVFVGSIINANIFGELAVILQGMGRTEKHFQSKLAAMNTAMINLNLPKDIQQQVRDQIIRYQASL